MMIIFPCEISEDVRPKPILPKHNLSTKDNDASNRSKSNNNTNGFEPETPAGLPPRPSSAMSEAFQPLPKDAYSRKLSLTDFLSIQAC